MIALPTKAEQVKLFERTLIGAFSRVNTRLAFDSQILLSKNKRDNFKLIYGIKTGAGIKEKKRVTTKILKMNENNQYGNAMTKPLPNDCIKKSKKVFSFCKFNIILSNLSHEDKIGHLFTVDIKFHNKNPKTMLFNKIYTPIFEKQKAVKGHPMNAQYFN